MKSKGLLSIERITVFILFLTMVAIAWQTKIIWNEFRVKNKPVVGIENITNIFIIPESDPRAGKLVTWLDNSKKFLCEGKDVQINGFMGTIQIKNFGSEPALDTNIESELIIGDRSIRTTIPEIKENTAIMPVVAVQRKVDR